MKLPRWSRFKHEYRGADILVSPNGYRVFYPQIVVGKLDYKLTAEEFQTLRAAKSFIDDIATSDAYPNTQQIEELISV